MEAYEALSPQLQSIILNLVIGAVILYPMWRIFRRSGMYPALALVVFVPMVGPLIAAVILAFARWPREPRDKRGWGG